MIFSFMLRMALYLLKEFVSSGKASGSSKEKDKS